MAWRWMVGGFFVVVAVVFAVDPSLFGVAEQRLDRYESIERRVTLGQLAALGFFVVYRGWRPPWQRIAAAAIGWLAAGYLLVRLIGVAIEGSDGKQWMWVGIEMAMMVACTWWVRRVDAASS